MEAAEAVGAGGGIEEENILDLLSNLAEKSLVLSDAEATDVVRYRMLESVRQYAREQLEESEEAQAIRRRHASFFLALAKEAEPRLTGAQQQAWADRREIRLWRGRQPRQGSGGRHPGRDPGMTRNERTEPQSTQRTQRERN